MTRQNPQEQGPREGNGEIDNTPLETSPVWVDFQQSTPITDLTDWNDSSLVYGELANDQFSKNGSPEKLDSAPEENKSNQVEQTSTPSTIKIKEPEVLEEKTPIKVDLSPRGMYRSVKKMLKLVTEIEEQGVQTGKSLAAKRIIGGIAQGARWPSMIGGMGAYVHFAEMDQKAVSVLGMNVSSEHLALACFGATLGVVLYTMADAPYLKRASDKIASRLDIITGNSRVVEKGISMVQQHGSDAAEMIEENHEDRFNVPRPGQLIDGFFKTIQNGSQIGLSLVVSGVVNAWLTIPVAATVAPILFGERFKAKKLRATTIEAGQAEKEMWPLRFGVTDIRNLVEFHVISKFEYFLDRFRGKSEEIADIKDGYIEYEALVGRRVALTNAAVVAGTSLTAFALTQIGHMAPRELVTFMLSMLSLQASVMNISSEIGKMLVNKQYVDRIYGEDEHVVESEKLNEYEHSVLRRLEKGFDVNFQDVSVIVDAEDKNKQKLKKMILYIDNLILSSKEFIGIVGLKGSGKTTLLSVLLRLREPSSGKISVRFHDNDERVNLKNIPMRSWKQVFNYMPQSGYLGTSLPIDDFINQVGKDNVYPSRDTDMLVDRLGIRKLIENTKKGWNARLRLETKFSGGESALIRTAQELKRNRYCTMIGDEITANMDTLTEQSVVDLIRELHPGMIIMVSHSQGFNDANKLLVMKKGKIEAFGPPKELLSTSPTFQDLFLGRLKKEMTRAESKHVQIEDNEIVLPNTIKGLNVRIAKDQE